MAREDRLRTERNIWLATARPDGRPHLTPIWFVWLEGRCWVCTGAGAVKTRNVRAQPKVVVALEDGNDPVVAEGTVSLHERPCPEPVAEAFLAKFGWDIRRTDDVGGPFDVLWEIVVDRWVM